MARRNASAAPAAEADAPQPEVPDRTEEYDLTKPDGTTVHVWHNIETGETRIV